MNLTKKIVTQLAKKTGFDLVGFTDAEELAEETDRLKDWLGKGFQAGMAYMEKNIEKRKDVNEILPDSKSVISLGLNYYTDDEYENISDRGKVSRYAWGKDYHLIIWEKLDEMIAALKEIDPGLEAKSYVDTGPVMDKAWAVRAGLGWMGKHTNVINKQMGSWFFIANIITNIKFEPDKPIEDFCGSCTACIDACPTNAIVDEYVVDANRCISYLTIENKKDIHEEFGNQFDNWLFGCDVCQDVCPWNIKFAEETSLKEFEPVNKEIPLNEFEGLTNSTFKKKYGTTPISRARLKGMKRNAAFLKSASK
ncbi:MAG: tRNA epoxyqueuosine(34) reductase QueG [Ignavibacteriae bacterium]|nr:tRNA epoxyqueuosine(34) reductase QueG [Ignavibacteriota bacterium]NOG99717.1 tRNA epoxyqueuosine(34) reductase QueG [Ignavibacteriota bacterium]